VSSGAEHVLLAPENGNWSECEERVGEILPAEEKYSLSYTRENTHVIILHLDGVQAGRRRPQNNGPLMNADPHRFSKTQASTRPISVHLCESAAY
jgi:hypothetical protein